MYMIFVCPYLYVSDFVTLLNLETYLLQSFFHIFGQHFSSVLYLTNEVVQHQILVMTFYDMFGHSSIIPPPPPPPRSRAARKSFLLYAPFYPITKLGRSAKFGDNVYITESVVYFVRLKIVF